MPMSIPPPNAVARLLGELVGRNVTAKVVPAVKPDPAMQAVATYLGECLTIKAVAYCDVAVGASLGAALVLVPPAVVDDSVKAKAIDECLVDNLYEVFNVMSAVFPQHGGDRVTLRALNADGVLPDDVKTFLTQSGKRLDLEISIAGYRSGRLAIMVG